MRCAIRRVVAAVGASLCIASTVGAAPEPAPVKQIAQPKIVAPAPADTVADPAAEGPRIRLRIDGNLVGRTFVLDATGRPQPVRARVSLLHGGQVVATTQADEWGRFQIVGIQPGVYSVLAAANDYVAAMSVHILPFDENAAGNALVLNVSLLPASELEMFKGLVGPVAPAATGVSTPAAAASAGGAAAGGGMGGLLGAAGAGLGAAGVAGAGGESGVGGGGGVASQFLPTPSASGNSPGR
jgi:hypothetical protein